MGFRRRVQLVCLVVFWLLLGLAVYPLVPWLPVDAFLRLDPAAAAVTQLAARAWIAAFLPAALVLGLTALLGRFFCGHVCPLGTTIDGCDRVLRQGRPTSSDTLAASWYQGKYLVLAALMGAALLGVSLAYLAAPLPLATRLYALVLRPVLLQIAAGVLTAAHPLADRWDWTWLAFADIPVHRYALPWFTFLSLALVLSLGLRARRLWCRAVCPAGALMAICARRPLLRRSVSSACTACGLCQRRCPMGAITADPTVTRHAECIVCGTCVAVCPVQAVHFAPGEPSPAPAVSRFSPSRRHWLAAGLGGMGAAAVTLTGAEHLLGSPGLAHLLPPSLIRPPGARPEADFLARCIRCGACLRACPTNTLQPLGLLTGLSGFYSPVVTPSLGPCEPRCNACGQVCPTGAIRPLPPADKLWAKIGTAQVLRHKCLAWEYDRPCLVCDETCPYDAVEFRRVAGLKVAVPFVVEERCSGCGFCEHHCPVTAQAAIVVEPMEALRLASGAFEQRARELGLSLRIRTDATGPPPGSPPWSPEGGPPGGSLPPGFSE
jgi:ferredoxin-type protein NapF